MFGTVKKRKRKRGTTDKNVKKGKRKRGILMTQI